MPVLVLPGNDTDRYNFLSATVATAESDATKGYSYLSNETIDMAKSLIVPMKYAMDRLAKSTVKGAKNDEEKNEALRKVEIYLRDLWIGIRNRVNREELPTSLLQYYGLPLSGLLPKTTSAATIIPLAEAVVAGDAQAVEAGYEPMLNPSAAELQAKVILAKSEVDDIFGADRLVNFNEEELATLRSKVDEAVREVVAELRFFLRRRDELNQRRIMRRYGVTFRSDKEEMLAN